MSQRLQLCNDEVDKVSPKRVLQYQHRSFDHLDIDFFAGTAIMHAFGLCERRVKPTCLEAIAHDTPDEDIQKWLRDYTVFTFVRNPFIRAASSYSYLNRMVRAAHIEDSRFLKTAYCKVDWTDFCHNPRILARHCRVFPECCGTMNLNTLQHHVDPQYPCMVGDDGQLAVDFIGRAEHSQEDYVSLAKLVNSKLPDGVRPMDSEKELEVANVQACDLDAGVLDKVRQGQESAVDVDCGEVDKYQQFYLDEASKGCFDGIATFYQEEVRHLQFRADLSTSA